MMKTQHQSIEDAVKELMRYEQTLEGQLGQSSYRAFHTFLDASTTAINHARAGDLGWMPELPEKTTETLAKMLAVLINQLIPSPSYQDRVHKVL